MSGVRFPSSPPEKSLVTALRSAHRSPGWISRCTAGAQNTATFRNNVWTWMRQLDWPDSLKRLCSSHIQSRPAELGRPVCAGRSSAKMWPQMRCSERPGPDRPLAISRTRSEQPRISRIAQICRSDAAVFRSSLAPKWSHTAQFAPSAQQRSRLNSVAGSDKGRVAKVAPNARYGAVAQSHHTRCLSQWCDDWSLGGRAITNSAGIDLLERGWSAGRRWGVSPVEPDLSPDVADVSEVPGPRHQLRR